MDMMFGSEIPIFHPLMSVVIFLNTGNRFTPKSEGFASGRLLVDFSYSSKVGYNITNVVKGVDVQFSPKESGWMDLGIWFNLLGPTSGGGLLMEPNEGMMSGLVGSLFHENPRWSNYSDLTRPHPKLWFRKGNPVFQGNLGWWNIIVSPDPRWLAGFLNHQQDFWSRMLEEQRDLMMIFYCGHSKISFRIRFWFWFLELLPYCWEGKLPKTKALKIDMDVEPKIVGFPPNHPF